MKGVPMKVFLFPLKVLIVLGFFLATAHAAPKKIDWDDLAPPSKGGKMIDFGKIGKPRGMPKVSEFGGSAEDMNAWVDNMGFMKQMQPQEGNQIATNLNGQEVKIAGYVTPLTFDGEKVVEFLFVPYLGACIHVPPPPANQIVYVSNAKGLKADDLYDPLWLTGTLRASPINTIVANAGYWIESAKVEPYSE